jgi:arylformamidase
MMALVGGAESDAFKNQTGLIREQWGAVAVPVCEQIAERNHFDVLHSLVEPDGRAHQLAAGLLGLDG